MRKGTIIFVSMWLGVCVLCVYVIHVIVYGKGLYPRIDDVPMWLYVKVKLSFNLPKKKLGMMCACVRHHPYTLCVCVCM